MSADWVPDSCTLPTADQPFRTAAFDELFRSAVRDTERVGPQHLLLTLDPTPSIASSVAELTVAETQCCSFFSFTLTATAGSLTLGISVPPNYVEVLDAMESGDALQSERESDAGDT